MTPKKGENDKKLAELLNDIDDGLVDDDRTFIEESFKVIRKQIIENYAGIGVSEGAPFSGAAVEEANRYLDYFSELTRS